MFPSDGGFAAPDDSSTHETRSSLTKPRKRITFEFSSADFVDAGYFGDMASCKQAEVISSVLELDCSTRPSLAASAISTMLLPNADRKTAAKGAPSRPRFPKGHRISERTTQSVIKALFTAMVLHLIVAQPILALSVLFWLKHNLE